MCVLTPSRTIGGSSLYSWTYLAKEVEDVSRNMSPCKTNFLSLNLCVCVCVCKRHTHTHTYNKQQGNYLSLKKKVSY